MRVILSIHINYKEMNIDSLEVFTARDSNSLSKEVLSLTSIKECVVLKTCNRLEVYTALDMDNKEAGKEELKKIFSGAESFRFLEGKGSVEHLMRVSSGMDSMVVGENEILGQVRLAYETARENKYAGNTLHKMFRKAISGGKKVRSGTDISKGAVSVASAAVKMGEELLRGLNRKKVIVIGAGRMGELLTKLLKKCRTEKVFITNRTYEKARKIADIIGGEAVVFSKFKRLLPETDLIFCATSANDYVIKREELEEIYKGNMKEIIMIDMSNPRNLDPKLAYVEGVNLLNIDNLKKISHKNLQKRKNEVKKGEKIIREELELYEKKMSENEAEEILGKVYKECNTLKSKEVERAFRSHEWDSKEKEIISNLTDSIVKKIMCLPTTILKEASRNGDTETLYWAERLYNVEGFGCIQKKE